MDRNFNLSREKAGVLLIDVQERLYPYMENGCHVMAAMVKVLQGTRILGLPVFATEQYPKGLGSTVPPLREALGNSQRYLSKTTFSCMGDEGIKELLLNSGINQWILLGIEAHVCVLQTAKGLLKHNMQVVVLNDAVSSRSIYDLSTGIAEMRDCGARISSTETVLFELLVHSKVAEFKEISQLIKSQNEPCGCMGNSPCVD